MTMDQYLVLIGWMIAGVYWFRSIAEVSDEGRERILLVVFFVWFVPSRYFTEVGRSHRLKSVLAMSVPIVAAVLWLLVR